MNDRVHGRDRWQPAKAFGPPPKAKAAGPKKAPPPLARGPNVEIYANPNNGLVSWFLYLKVTKQIPKGRELLLKYNNDLWFDTPEMLVRTYYG